MGQVTTSHLTMHSTNMFGNSKYKDREVVLGLRGLRISMERHKSRHRIGELTEGEMETLRRVGLKIMGTRHPTEVVTTALGLERPSELPPSRGMR